MAALLLGLAATPAGAMDFQPFDTLGGKVVIRATGSIVAGDADRLSAVIAKAAGGGGEVVALIINSPAAAFFAGEHELARSAKPDNTKSDSTKSDSAKSDAAAWLRRAVATCRHGSQEGDAARAELKALDEVL